MLFCSEKLFSNTGHLGCTCLRPPHICTLLFSSYLPSTPTHSLSPDNSVISDVTLRALGKACRELQHVYLAGCSRITDQGLRALGSLRKLQVLNIADCTRLEERDPWLLHYLILSFPLHTPTLLLNTYTHSSPPHTPPLPPPHTYSRVSDAGVRYIIENAPGPQLQELNLTNCIKISDVTLLRMSQK